MLFQVLMVKTDSRGNDGIGGGEDPAEDGDEVHAIKYHAVADGEAFVLADVGHAGGG